METGQINRLMMVVVQTQDADIAMSALNEVGHSVTRLSSSGGFLGNRNITLLIGLIEGQEPEIVRILKHACRQRVEYITTSLEGAPFHLPLSTPVPVGGATVFTLAVVRYEVF